MAQNGETEREISARSRPAMGRARRGCQTAGQSSRKRSQRVSGIWKAGVGRGEVMDCGRFSMGAVLFFYFILLFSFWILNFLNFDFRFCWDSPHHVRTPQLATHRPSSSGTQPGWQASMGRCHSYGATTYLITCGSLS